MSIPGRASPGRSIFGVKTEIAAAFLAAPPVAPNQAAALAEALERRFPGLGLPAPRTELVEEISRRSAGPGAAPSRPASAPPAGIRSAPAAAMIASTSPSSATSTTARSSTRASAPSELRHVEDGRVVVRRRHYAAEAAFHRRLTECIEADLRFRKGEGRGQAARVQLRSRPRFVGRFCLQHRAAAGAKAGASKSRTAFGHTVVDGGGEWDAGFSRMRAGGFRSISASRSTASGCRCCRC